MICLDTSFLIRALARGSTADRRLRDRRARLLFVEQSHP